MSKSPAEDKNSAKKNSRKHKKCSKSEAVTADGGASPPGDIDTKMFEENPSAVGTTSQRTDSAEHDMVPVVSGTPATEPASEAGTSLSVEDRLARLEREVDVLRSRLAGYEGQEIFRRFRHHVMYDLIKAAKIDIPPRMNPKKRTNFPLLIKCVRESSAKIPEEWLEGLKGLEAFDAEVDKLFPLGFWDNVDNSSVSEAMIETYINKLPAESDLRKQVRAMCRCCLQCTPPCARGNGNAPNKGANVPGLNLDQEAAEQQDNSAVTPSNETAKTLVETSGAKKIADATKVKKSSKRSKSAGAAGVVA